MSQRKSKKMLDNHVMVIEKNIDLEHRCPKCHLGIMVYNETFVLPYEVFYECTNCGNIEMCICDSE